MLVLEQLPTIPFIANDRYALEFNLKFIFFVNEGIGEMEAERNFQFIETRTGNTNVLISRLVCSIQYCS